MPHGSFNCLCCPGLYIVTEVLSVELCHKAAIVCVALAYPVIKSCLLNCALAFPVMSIELHVDFCLKAALIVCLCCPSLRLPCWMAARQGSCVSVTLCCSNTVCRGNKICHLGDKLGRCCFRMCRPIQERATTDCAAIIPIC